MNKFDKILKDHAESCDACEEQALEETAPAVLDELFSALPIIEPRAGFDLALSSAARVQLQHNFASTQRRRLAAAVALALIPLPFAVFYGVAAISFVGAAAARLLPGAAATYVTGAYTASIVLVYALTYAALPLLLDDSGEHGHAGGTLPQHGVA